MQSNLNLLCNNFFCDAQFPFSQCFANAQDNSHTSLNCSCGTLVYSFIGFAEVLSALRVTNDNILYAHLSQHISRDLAGKCAVLFEVNVFCADFNVGAFGQRQSSFQVCERYADDYAAGLVCCDRLQSVNQLSSLFAVLVHLPVAGNNCLSQCLVHDKFLFSLIRMPQHP